MPQFIFTMKDLRKVTPQGKEILKGIWLSFYAGAKIGVLGANGAGKSTLLKALMGLVPIGHGQIEFRGSRTNGRPAHEMARLGIAYVPEGRGTLRSLTVRENLVLGASAQPRGHNLDSDLRNVLDRFPALAERVDQIAGTLSGGQQQMLVIARALMARPRLMLLDEPSLGLAPLIARTIFEIIADLRSQGVTVLLVEQNAHAALKLASRAYVLEMGRIVLEGSDLLGDPRVRRAYLGEIEAS
jgi:branched-chain amino acid transport system ATP-binding protein